ncbi:MAG: hypothetical protein WAO09_06715 [Candidatus Dormiibacterota bacterium]
MSDSKAAQEGFVTRVEEGLRADVKADEHLVQQIISDLIEKVEALERRIAKLEQHS